MGFLCSYLLIVSLLVPLFLGPLLPIHPHVAAELAACHLLITFQWLCITTNSSSQNVVQEPLGIPETFLGSL